MGTAFINPASSMLLRQHSLPRIFDAPASLSFHSREATLRSRWPLASSRIFDAPSAAFAAPHLRCSRTNIGEDEQGIRCSE